jgi:acetyl-CoA carboxylase carboxyl transferase subunit beta
MSWLSKEPTRVQSVSQKKSIPEGIWEKCEKCGEISLASEFLESHRVCSHCGFHARLPALERLELLLDAGTFLEWDSQLKSCDPLEFNDGRSYASRLNTQFQKTQRLDAFISGTGKLGDHSVALGVLDFFWMGGSMGTVVGEKIYRLFVRAQHHKLPVIICSASGGARMHEGLLSLMQMAKTCSAVAKQRDAGLPFISVLCDPTTGGVAASYAMLGDINIAEPGATIGFAGRRVVENTIRQKLPEDFQTSEFLLSHGMLDRIVKRNEMKEFINRCLKILTPPRPQL